MPTVEPRLCLQAHAVLVDTGKLSALPDPQTDVPADEVARFLVPTALYALGASADASTDPDKALDKI